MKRKKINSLLSLASLVIAAILTACIPPTNSGGDSESELTFKSLGINTDEKKIIVFFSTDISGTPNASRITVKKGTSTLEAQNYTLTVEKGNLVITLEEKPTSGAQYTVELQAEAVRDASGKPNTANTSSRNKTFTVGIMPAIKPGSLAFRAKSGKGLILSFNTNMEIVDKNKIKVEVRTAGKGEFKDTPATSKLNTATKNLLELTLATAAINNNVYRVRVEAGALKATASNLANTAELTSGEFTYSTSLILDTVNPPHILNNKLVATFNLPIAIKEWEKAKVYKDPTKGSDGEVVPLEQNSIAVNDDNRKLLEITLPKAVATGEVYRLRLDAGAVNAKSNPDNANKIIAPADITIGASPSLDADKAPFLGQQKIIVTFDGPISILNAAGIKYRFEASLGAGFDAAIEPDNKPKVISDNQLEIPLNAIPTEGQIYRIHLEIGALGGDKNQPSTGNIQPENKDMTATGPTLTNVTPVFASKTQLSVTFPVAVAIVGDGSKINVQKKDEGGSFTTLTAENRDIAVDGMNSKKITITLTGSEETTLYKVWKVIFPANTVETAINSIPNSSQLTTGEGVLKLTELYSWNLVSEDPESREPVDKASKPLKWLERYSHASVVFNNKIWVLGGAYGSDKLNDVWNSEDGVIWKQMDDSADWPGRYSHTSVVFPLDRDEKKIWVLGGHDGKKRLNDVWSSADGITWTESKPPKSAPKNTAGKNKNWWTARREHTSVTFKDKIWVIGGNSVSVGLADGSIDKNDVWSSADGSVWVEEIAIADWEVRSNHTSVVFKNKIWVIGGSVFGATSTSSWSSANGKNWDRSTAKLPNGVSGARTVEYDGRLWSLGGGSTQTKSFWSSADPANSWTDENTLKSAIRNTQAVVFQNRIWLLGGKYGGIPTSRVWNIGPGSE